METLYRKVAVSDRLPQSSGYYWIEDVVGEMKSAWYLPKEKKFGVSSLGKKEIAKYWLEPVKSKSPPQVEKLEADKAELLNHLQDEINEFSVLGYEPSQYQVGYNSAINDIMEILKPTPKI